MRDDRYWNGNHPDSAAWRRAVSDGWRQLVAAETGPADRVEVRGYTRMVNGRSVGVRAHSRTDPPGGDHAVADVPAALPALGALPAPKPAERPTREVAYRSRQECAAQHEADLKICRMLSPPNRRPCWQSAFFRQVQCNRGAEYIPPLNVFRLTP
jgi:hypothetical protein